LVRSIIKVSWNNLLSNPFLSLSTVNYFSLFRIQDHIYIREVLIFSASFLVTASAN
jgi:hypothetical protein